jgi:hypothetical protein
MEAVTAAVDGAKHVHKWRFRQSLSVCAYSCCAPIPVVLEHDQVWRRRGGLACGHCNNAKKARAMAKKFPLEPSHPERVCWGCDRYCPATSMACGNGAGRTQHPAEMFGEDWYLDECWGIDPELIAKTRKESSS